MSQETTIPQNLGHLIPPLPTEEVTVQEEATLSPAVAIDENTRDYSKELVVFNFSDYNPKHCELQNFDKNTAKALTGKLTTLSGVIVQELRHYFKDKVEGGGKYEALYETVGQDVDLYEIEYGAKGRIYGHLFQNQLRVVAFGKFKHK